MERNGPAGRVTSSTGDVDLHGDVLNTMTGRRLRRTVGADHAPGVDLDAHLTRVALVIEHARTNRPHLHLLLRRPS